MAALHVELLHVNVVAAPLLLVELVEPLDDEDVVPPEELPLEELLGVEELLQALAMAASATRMETFICIGR